MRHLTITGFGITALWIGAFAFVLSYYQESAAQMGLNEWGDFLAGFSAPLALLWLVIGYFQQGAELRLNTEALKTQQEELRRQVEETKNLVAHTARHAKAAERQVGLSQYELEREEQREKDEAQPVFWASGGGSVGGNAITTRLQNLGGDAYDIELDWGGDYDMSFTPAKRWPAGQSGKIMIQQRSRSVDYPFRFKIIYRDKDGTIHEKEFEFVATHEFKEVEASS